jgi:flagellar motor switch protein FliN/FliY
MAKKEQNGGPENNKPKPAAGKNASAMGQGEKSTEESPKPRKDDPAPQSRSGPDGMNNEKTAEVDKPQIDAESVDLNVILDIPLEITVELGRTRMPIHELLNLGPGSAVALSRLEGEPVDILANNTLIARGVVLVNNNRYGIRITEITSHLDRIKSLT